LPVKQQLHFQFALVAQPAILHLHKAATSCTVSDLILQSLFTHRMRPLWFEIPLATNHLPLKNNLAVHPYFIVF
jgi:hypothetical protein